MKLFLTITLSLVCGIFANSEKDHEVSLDMSCQKALSSVVCTFEFTNSGLDDVYILKRNTPLEGFLSPFIAVTSPQGYPLQYQGFLIYRTPLTKDEFVLLKAGKSITASVDITKGFSLNDNGLYNVQYIKPLEVMLMGRDGIMSTNLCEFASFYLEDSHALSQLTYFQESQEEVKNEEKSDIVTVNQGCCVRFIGGTSAQRDKFGKAIGRLCYKLPRVANNIRYDNQYQFWFGNYNSNRFNTVKRVFQASANGLLNNVVTYDMNGSGCKKGVVAYTYHGSKSIFACPYMHTLPVYCTNSNNIRDLQESIIFHEWSHAFGYTQDHSYGVQNDQHLARYTPDKAVNNADNFERYYCPASFTVRQ